MKITNTKNLKFAGPPKRGSKYDKVLEELIKLKAGQSLLIPLNGVAKRTAHNRLNAAMRRVDVQPPKGCKWVKRTTVHDEIAVSAMPNK